MTNITFTVVQKENIEECRELCNELMALQKSRATIGPECFDSMNFDTRMKKSYENALRSQVIIVKDNGLPIGYVFSTIDQVEESDRKAYPDWAPVGENFIGFFPDWLELPQKIGCLSNLYLKDQYRGSGIGLQLLEKTLEWLESFSDVDLTFVYISNGNDGALDFYLSQGFTYSHDVFGGFIKATYRHKK